MSRGRPKKGHEKKNLLENISEPNLNDIEEEEEFEEEEEEADEELDFESHRKFDTDFYTNDDEL